MVVSGIPFLTSVDAKLSMAEEHLAKLEGSFKSIGESDGCSFTFQHNSNSTEVAMWVKFDPPPGVRWGAIVGNFVNDLRNALDHIVYAIAVGESGRNPPPDGRRLMFPIADSEDDWKGVRGRVRTLSESVRTVIEHEQPFARRQRNEFSPLSTLGQLNDRDKHRVISLGASLMQEAKFTFPGPIQPSGLQTVLARKDPVIDQAPLVVFQFSKPNPNVTVEAKLSFGVVLDIERGWRPALPILRGIKDETIRVLNLLRPFVR